MATNARQTSFPLPKTELYYYDITDEKSKPVPVTADGFLKVSTDLVITGGVVVDSVQQKTGVANFHNATTSTGDGTTFNVGAFKSLRIEIWGTASAREVRFYGLGLSGEKRPITGVRSLDLVTATETTGNNEFWQFDIEGLEKVVMTVASLSGGNVSVRGKAVS